MKFTLRCIAFSPSLHQYLLNNPLAFTILQVTLPPLGFQTFFVREGKINSSSAAAFSEQKLLKLPQPLEDIVIENNVS